MPTTGTFKLINLANATPFNSTGGWNNPSGVLYRLGCTNNFDGTGCGDFSGHLAYNFGGNCWLLDGALIGSAIPFASLPAGFTITDCTGYFSSISAGTASGQPEVAGHFTISMGGVDFAQDATSQALGAMSALDAYASFVTIDATTTNFVDSWVSVNPQNANNFSIEGTYEIQQYYVDCNNVEVSPGVFANVCTTNTTGEGDPFDIGSFPLQWWNLGILWLYQPFSPGPGWTSGVEPDFTGWYKSFEEFAGGALVIDGNQRPRDPRDYDNLTGYLGTPQIAHVGQGLSAVFHNHLIYARRNTTGTATLGVFDGLSDRTIATIPPQSDGSEIIDILSVKQTGGAIYVTTLDDGTGSSDWTGRVFRLDPTAGTLTQMGNTFTGGYAPYVVEWYNGRLYCGTNPSKNDKPGKLYSMLPDYDTQWTEVYDVGDGDSGTEGITFLQQFQGKLWFGVGGTDGQSAQIWTVDPSGAIAWSTENGDGSAKDGSLYGAAAVFGDNLYVSYWSEDDPTVSTIVKWNGTAWSTVKTFDNDKPVILLRTVGDTLYAVQGGLDLPVSLWKSTNGSSWTDVTDFLPSGDTTVGIPAFEALY